MTSTERRPRFEASRLAGWAGSLFLISVVLVFFVIRLSTDLGNMSAGVIPHEGEFARRYALHPALAYSHIIPGVVYLVGAPFQLSRAIRTRHIGFHRALGKVVLVAGLLSGALAIAVGVTMPFGGAVEGSASVVFGIYFLASLSLAYRAIRSLRIVIHRRWMIRAFAVGVGVGLIRVVVGLLEGLQLTTFEKAFGVAFWIAFVTMTAAAELWLWRRPAPYPD